MRSAVDSVRTAGLESDGGAARRRRPSAAISRDDADVRTPVGPLPVVPSWFFAGLVAAVVWCATAGTAGVALLIVGLYHALAVGAIATTVSVIAAIAVLRRLGPRRPASHGAALAAVALALSFFALAAAFHSEHLLLDRDPAGYINTGRSIARTHELRPKTQLEVYADPAFGDPDTRYQPNFFPMLPVLLAAGWSVGGDSGMLLVGPALGALGLLACYALGSRVLGARWALVVPVFLVLEPLQLWFARDAYSELVVEVLALGGLWLYLEARARRRWGVALGSGLLVASSGLARVDALAIILGSVLLVAFEWIRCDVDPVPVAARRTVAAFLAGLLGGTAIAYAMTHAVAGGYIRSLHAEYHQLLAALVAALAALAVVVVAHRLGPGLVRRLVTSTRVFVGMIAVGTAAVVWAYQWRPDPLRDLPPVRPGQVLTPAVRAAAINWHFSRSLHWFSAYIGLAGIAVAFAGFVVLLAWARRWHPGAAPVLLVALPLSVMYLASPSVTPDQPWAMRRYLPVVIPGIAIAIAVAIHAGWRAARRVRGPLLRTVAGVGLVAMVAVVAVPTAASARPFVTARMQHGAQAALHHVCTSVGRDNAIMVYGYHVLDQELSPPLRSFCGVPVAYSGTADLTHVARLWNDSARRLFVITTTPQFVRRTAPRAVIVAHEVVSDDGEPERVLDRSPARSEPVPVDIFVLRIPPT